MVVSNHKLGFLNIKTIGLDGKPHPGVQYLLTQQDVKMARTHLKYYLVTIVPEKKVVTPIVPYVQNF